MTALAVTLAFLTLAARSPENRPYPPFATDIAKVESGGSWQDGSRLGSYRAVVRKRCTPDECFDDLFLEWLRWERHEKRLVSRERVAEVGGVSCVAALRFVSSRNQTWLEVTQESGDVDHKWVVCLEVGLPGKYLSKEGPCGG